MKLHLRECATVAAAVAAAFAACYCAGRFIPDARAEPPSPAWQPLNPGESLRWPIRVISIAYDSRGEGSHATYALPALLSAMRQWETICNVKFAFLGNLPAGFNLWDGLTVVSWDANDMPDHVAAWTGIAKWPDSNYLLESDIAVNPRWNYSPQELEVILRHELGHLLGFGHDNAPDSALGPWQYTLPLPGPTNAAGCTALYGPLPQHPSRRIPVPSRVVLTR